MQPLGATFQAHFALFYVLAHEPLDQLVELAQVSQPLFTLLAPVHRGGRGRCLLIDEVPESGIRHGSSRLDRQPELHDYTTRHGTVPEVRPVAPHRCWVTIRRKDDAATGCLQASAQAASTTEQIGGCGVLLHWATEARCRARALPQLRCQWSPWPPRKSHRSASRSTPPPHLPSAPVPRRCPYPTNATAYPHTQAKANYH